MGMCMMIGGAIFTLTLVLTLLYLIGSFIKNAGISYFNIGGIVLFFTMLILCFGLEYWAFFEKEQWVEAIFPIFLNLYLLVILYIHFYGAMVIGKKYIYRVGHGLIVRRYSFDQVKKCSCKNESGAYKNRTWSKKTVWFAVEVLFKDGKQSIFRTNSHNSPKAKYFLETLRALQRKR